jgi:hypothetical protein
VRNTHLCSMYQGRNNHVRTSLVWVNWLGVECWLCVFHKEGNISNVKVFVVVTCKQPFMTIVPIIKGHD